AGTPPAAIYGWVIPQTGFSPAPGTAVRAYIDGIPCGSGVITRIGSNLAYVVDVFSDGFGTNAGCGRPGAMVSMVINGVQAAEPVAWDNTRLTELTLRGTINSIGGEQRTLYLPAILK
ncbi:MAG: hypothetical protein KDD78_10960, partial [Caldilineaceae bacterium]|nr:hypothetical protein [Caldilineaceae bacterium]